MRHLRIGFFVAAALCLAVALFRISPAVAVASSRDPKFPDSPQPAGQGGAPTNPQQEVSLGLLPPPDTAAVDRGKQIFSANCTFCHGASATGGETGPDLVRSVVVLHDQGKGTAIGPVVLNGRPGRGMPKFDFNEDQIKDIAAFLLSRNQAAANRRSYQVLDLLTGDPKAGKAYFDSHCASCHSVAGDLAHVASKFELPILQERFLYPARTIADSAPSAADLRAQKTVTVTLASGQSYSGKLLHFDDFSVALLDASGEYHSWELNGSENGIKVDVHDPLDGHLKLMHEYTDADIHNVLAYLDTLK
jgi:cytochrome c oxidase cbb3-type subunit 3